MFNKEMLNNIKTVGIFMLFNDTLAFMIGPDNSGEKLGIVRFGGHIEEGENISQALYREIIEECSIEVNLINSPKTFYIKDWNDSELSDITNEINYEIKPLLIKGVNNRLTALFLSNTVVEPIPSSETNGIIFLKKQDIFDICTKKITCLSDFLERGGKLIQQNVIDLHLEMHAGVHLKLLYNLLLMHNQIIIDFLNGKM